ncbi:uncharacterized protein [Battus philenor]|uniref:uncharacterized protein n=1 Tax=Battus philenor TaxID=42288 RepID=UPI0035D072B6
MAPIAASNLACRFQQQALQSSNIEKFPMPPYQRFPIVASNTSACTYQHQELQSPCVAKFPMPSYQRHSIVSNSISGYMYQQQHIQSPSIENFEMPSYQRPPIVANNNSVYICQQQQAQTSNIENIPMSSYQRPSVIAGNNSIRNHQQQQAQSSNIENCPMPSYQRPLNVTNCTNQCNTTCNYRQTQAQSSNIANFQMPSHQRPPNVASSSIVYMYQEQLVQSSNIENIPKFTNQKHPIVVSNNSESRYQLNQTGRDKERFTGLDILNVKRQRAQYSRPKLQESVKNRKNRTVLNAEQVFTLEKIFHEKPYISIQERLELTEKLNIREQEISRWFENQRRLCGYKESVPTVCTGSSENVVERKFDLEHVESIMRTPDKDGYVTLDEKAITELMTAIEEVIPDINWENLNDEITSNINI